MNKFTADKNAEIASVKAVERIIGYTFNDKKILRRAITHKSYCVLNGLDDSECYQRLEFLGDSILDFVVADELFRNYPQFDEGAMTKFRANVVSREPLADIIDRTKISDYILFDKNAVSLSKKIKSDFFESIVAAIYLDSNGMKSTRQFILKYLKQYINAELQKDNNDYKSMLYELASSKKWDIRFEQLETSGPPHDLTFTMQLVINDEVICCASGKKKQDAEKLASRIAMEKLQGEGK